MDDYHGDEDEIREESRRIAEEYENEHADDWKHQETFD